MKLLEVLRQHKKMFTGKQKNHTYTIYLYRQKLIILHLCFKCLKVLLYRFVRFTNYYYYIYIQFYKSHPVIYYKVIKYNHH